MGLESSTTIASLNNGWPLATDKRSEGDDHLRLIKAVLKAQFPGAGGQGFAVPLTVTEAELNALHNQKVDMFPSGTKLVFYQAATPPGWTAIAIADHYTLIIGTGNSGGIVDEGNGDLATGCTLVPDHFHLQQGSFLSGTSNQSLSHSHSTAVPATDGPNDAQSVGSGINVATATVAAYGSSVADLTAHNHTVTIGGFTSGNQAGNTGDWKPKYATVMIASKD